MHRKPGRAPAQEKACQGPQRPEPGALQEQSPPPTAFRPGEQPPAGTHTRQEEEETPEQETLNGEFKIFYLIFIYIFSLSIALYQYSTVLVHGLNYIQQMLLSTAFPLASLTSCHFNVLMLRKRENQKLMPWL